MRKKLLIAIFAVGFSFMALGGFYAVAGMTGNNPGQIGAKLRSVSTDAFVSGFGQDQAEKDSLRAAMRDEAAQAQHKGYVEVPDDAIEQPVGLVPLDSAKVFSFVRTPKYIPSNARFLGAKVSTGEPDSVVFFYASSKGEAQIEANLFKEAQIVFINETLNAEINGVRGRIRTTKLIPSGKIRHEISWPVQSDEQGTLVITVSGNLPKQELLGIARSL